MKRMTASDARKHWFRLLDEVVEGAVVCIDRGGRRIILRREDNPEDGAGRDPIPEYHQFLRVPELEDADGWGWSWSDQDGTLEPEG